MARLEHDGLWITRVRLFPWAKSGVTGFNVTVDWQIRARSCRQGGNRFCDGHCWHRPWSPLLPTRAITCLVHIASILDPSRPCIPPSINTCHIVRSLWNQTQFLRGPSRRQRPHLPLIRLTECLVPANINCRAHFVVDAGD